MIARLCLAVGVAVVAPRAVQAGSGPGIAGDYVCTSDCHRSDAPPSIEIDGDVATCRNDLGGVFRGELLTARSVACFNMVGELSPDGNTLSWSNGSVWVRRR